MLLISDLLQQAVDRHGDAIAIVAGDARLSYRELDDRASRLAAFLQSRGVGQGSPVALYLRNGAEYVIADIAILKLAAIKVPLNELMAPAELSYCLAHCAAAAIVSDASLPEPAPQETIRLYVSVGARSESCNPWVDWETALEHEPLETRQIPMPDDPALIAYTGGTTGQPKGVQHSQHRLAVNLLAHVLCGDVRHDEVMLLTTPLPHSAGYHLQSCLLQGGTVVISARFDAHTFIETVERHGVTWTFAVPTMLYRLFDQMKAVHRSPSSLRTIVYGAAPMAPARLAEGLEMFGPIFIQLFGQTECPNYITTLSKDDHLKPHLLGSCGRAVPFLKIRCVDGEGRAASTNDVGEVEVASPYLLTAYHANPEATATTIRNGWLRTGDLGYIDGAGYLFLVDRAKDMIISGGMNVYSVEVEAALLRHPGVKSVAVVGQQDDDWGEIVVACIVPEGAVDERDIRLFAKNELSGYKVPKRYVFLDHLPVTNFGKIDKKHIRNSLL